MFHREGHRIIVISFMLSALIVLCLHFFLDKSLLNSALQLVVILLFVFLLQFFRNPTRISPKDDTKVLAPADGRVLSIDRQVVDEYFGDERIKLAIFMSPINVHVTRYPVGGEVVYSKHTSGKYLLAWYPKSSVNNEHTTVVLYNKIFGEVLYRQIAGFVARRIVNYAKEGMKVEQGKESGFIKFGSRLDIYLPINSTIKVKPKQFVRGGIDVLASIAPEVGKS